MKIGVSPTLSQMAHLEAQLNDNIEGIVSRDFSSPFFINQLLLVQIARAETISNFRIFVELGAAWLDC